MSANDMNRPVVIPSELIPLLPAPLPACTNRVVTVVPIGSGPYATGTTIQCDIPVGKRNTFIDTNSIFARWKNTYASPAGGTVTTHSSRLLGSGFSTFNKYEVVSGGVSIDMINEPGVMMSHLLNSTLSDSQKRALSTNWGFDFAGATAYSSGSTAGHRIWQAATGNEGLVHEYAIPLPGVLGTGSSKFFPLENLFSLSCMFTVDDVANFTAALVLAYPLASVSVSNFELIFNMIEVSEEIGNEIRAMSPLKTYLRCHSYRQSSGSFPASSGAGGYDILVGARVSSLKSMFIGVAPTDAVEKKFACVNPNLTSGTGVVIANTMWPARGIDHSATPARAFCELAKANGSLTSGAFNGGISKNAYLVGSTAYGLCSAYNTTPGNIMTSPNQHIIAYDTESFIAGERALLTGVNCQSTPVMWHANIGAPLSAVTHNIYFFSYHDIILEIDNVSKTIMAKT